jgi:hypothetical protein
MLVPKSYADLLRSGDDSDWDLARDMDDNGLVPNSLVIRDSSGAIAGKTIVSFNSWTKKNGFAVTSR